MKDPNDTKTVCLFCKDTGRVIVDHVGVLTTTTDCPVGCEDKMFEGCEETPHYFAEIDPESDPC